MRKQYYKLAKMLKVEINFQVNCMKLYQNSN